MTLRINDNGIDRNMTPEEDVAHKVAVKLAALDDKQMNDALAAHTAAKNSAKAKLVALGLTNEEIAALVG